MKGLKQKLAHAFAVDEEQGRDVEPTTDQTAPVDWLCQQVVKRQLATPGMMALEVARPLNYVASQGMFFMSPAVWALAPKNVYENYRSFAGFLGRRGSLEYMTNRIEELEAERVAERNPTPDDGPEERDEAD